MKKELTEKDIRKIITEIMRKEQDKSLQELALARLEMQESEEELVKTLDKSQQALYRKFYKDREYFYYIARSLYKLTY